MTSRELRLTKQLSANVIIDFPESQKAPIAIARGKVQEYANAFRTHRDPDMLAAIGEKLAGECDRLILALAAERGL